MSRTVIQIGADRVAFNGHDWTPLTGERSEGLARLMRSAEPQYRRQAASHPDHAYNVALAAAEDWRGRIVEYLPDTAEIAPGRVY